MLHLADDLGAAFRFAVEKSREEPQWFFDRILNAKLDPWQAEGYEALADIWRPMIGQKTRVNHESLNRITVRAGHGPGKTWWMAGGMHYFNWCWRGRIPVTAPKLKQVTTRTWPTFRRILAGAQPLYRELIKVDTARITWGGDIDWCAMAETAAEPESLAGFHDDFMLFCVEEASGVNEELFPVIEGALSSGQIVALMQIANPTQNQGSFYESFNRAEVAQDYYRLHADLARAPRVRKDWVEKMVRKYGERSAVVQVRVFGNFSELGKDQLIALSWIEKARMKEWPAEGDGTHPRRRISVDVADGGEDETSITLAKHYETATILQKQVNFSFPQAESPIMAADAAERIWLEAGCKAENGDDFVVDCLGVGAGTAGTLIRRGYPVVQFRGGSSSSNPKKWRNRRSQSYIAMRDDFRDGRVVIEEGFCDDPEDMHEFEAQLCSIKSKPDNERVEDLETKKAMRGRGAKSPDRGDSTMMQWADDVPTLEGPSGTAGDLPTAQSEAARGNNW